MEIEDHEDYPRENFRVDLMLTTGKKKEVFIFFQKFHLNS